MTKAFGYLRVSGKSQLNGDGFPRQREAILAHAAANGFEIIEWFEEKAVPGKTEWENRPAWSAMIERLNGTRTIIIEKLDRLARDLFIQEYILRDLKKRKVELLTAADEDTSDADATRKMFRQILGAIAEYDRTMIVNKLRAARNRQKAATGHCEGKKPYGATPLELETLEKMKCLRNENGLSYSAIAELLNAESYKTRHGKTWHSCTVQKILERQS